MTVELEGIPTGFVTPCAGVWIEMDLSLNHVWSSCVTPCAGVWIEIGRHLV